MNRLSLAALSRFTIAGAAHADCLKANAGAPPGANMTDPKPPSYIDTTELDFKTLPPTRDPRDPNYPTGDQIARRRAPRERRRRQFHHRPTHQSGAGAYRPGRRADGQGLLFTMSSKDSTV